jgi:hypothetical protein
VCKILDDDIKGIIARYVREVKEERMAEVIYDAEGMQDRMIILRAIAIG